MTTEDAKAKNKLFGIPLKWVSLLLMVAQMVGMVCILRISRTQVIDGPRYLNTTAVLWSEVMKFQVSLILIWRTSADIQSFRDELWLNTIGRPSELLMASLPSVLYTIQNNLLFVGLTHLSAGLYQVTYQFKILTTAVLSVLILGTRLTGEKWISLLVLTGGVALVSYSSHAVGEQTHHENSTLGLLAVTAACFTSGFAGVYTEKMLKRSSVSLWTRNMQLAMFGSLFAVVIALKNDGATILQNGMLQGYSPLVWTVVVCQALGGFVNGAVMKYADNILKCFGCAIAIIFTCLVSVFELHEFTPSGYFIVGTGMVLVATCIYSLGVPRHLLRARALQPSSIAKTSFTV